jgi:hypothetical protein
LKYQVSHETKSKCDTDAWVSTITVPILGIVKLKRVFSLLKVFSLPAFRSGADTYVGKKCVLIFSVTVFYQYFPIPFT